MKVGVSKHGKETVISAIVPFHHVFKVDRRDEICEAGALFCIVGDALYCSRPIMDVCRANKWEFVLVFKEGADCLWHDAAAYMFDANHIPDEGRLAAKSTGDPHLESLGVMRIFPQRGGNLL